MNDVERIVAEFHTAVEAVWDPPPGDVGAVMRRGRRRRILSRAAVAGVGAALVAAVTGAAVALLPVGGPSEVAGPEVEHVDPPAADDASADRGPAPDEGSEDADCSAAGMDANLPPQDLPVPVAETRQRIAEAAVACDYQRLETLAATTSEFIYSFGGGDEPATHWQQREADGEDVLAELVTLLELEPGTTDPGDVAGEMHVWPAVFALDDPSRDDFGPVIDAGLYTEDDVERWLEMTGEYGGYRVGIDKAGHWRFFVAGD